MPYTRWWTRLCNLGRATFLAHVLAPLQKIWGCHALIGFCGSSRKRCQLHTTLFIAIGLFPVATWTATLLPIQAQLCYSIVIALSLMSVWHLLLECLPRPCPTTKPTMHPSLNTRLLLPMPAIVPTIAVQVYLIWQLWNRKAVLVAPHAETCQYLRLLLLMYVIRGKGKPVVLEFSFFLSGYFYMALIVQDMFLLLDCRWVSIALV
jgi:hypothetical protein